MKKILSLAYLLKEDAICLALKKRGFGEGYWNGFGGKLEEGETVLESAVREMKEESTVIVHEENLEKIAINEFLFKDGTHLEVHVFFAHIFLGTPQETEEMNPCWFSYEDIPYKYMWASDPYWLSRALSGEKLLGKVWFQEDARSIEKMEWNSAVGF